MHRENNRLQTAKNGNHHRHYGNKWQFPKWQSILDPSDANIPPPNHFFKFFFGVFNEFAIRRRFADAMPGRQPFRTAGSEMLPSARNCFCLRWLIPSKRETSKNGWRMNAPSTFRKEADFPEFDAEIPVHPRVRFFLKALIPISTEKRTDGIAVF